jgi:hypothetical protein
MVHDDGHRVLRGYPAEFVAAAFTVYVRHGVQLFIDENTVRRFESIILAETEHYRCEPLVYLFMPHRCHFILQGRDGHSSLLNAAKGFRHEAGYWLSRIHCETRWSERSLSDVRRIREEIANHVRFILNKPVRVGLVDDWKQYRFKGSAVCHLDSWS